MSVQEVRRNFERYGLVDDQVRLLEGWFQDTLPSAPIESWRSRASTATCSSRRSSRPRRSIPKLSVGGYLIVDDYALPGCRRAIDEFRREHAVSEPIQDIDWTGAFWQRQG